MAAPTVGLHLNFRGYVTEFSARNPHSFFGETPTRFERPNRINQAPAGETPTINQPLADCFVRVRPEHWR